MPILDCIQSKALAAFSRVLVVVIVPVRKLMIVDRETTSIVKACKLVGVSRRTIYNWISSGKVEYVRTAGGSVRIFVDTLWREADDQKTPPQWSTRPARQDVKSSRGASERYE